MRTSLLEILAGVERLKVVENTVEGEVGDVEMYIKEAATACAQLFNLTGKNLEQERLRFMAILLASGEGCGAWSGQGRYAQSIMEDKDIQNLRIVS